VTASTPFSGVSGALSVLDFWHSLDLARRFAVLALFLAVAGTVVLGAWVSKKIEQSAMARQANSAALYMGHFVAPLLQELATQDRLSPERFAQLGEVLQTASLRLRVEAMKIWSLDGRILYSDNPTLVGKQFPIDDSLQRALEGHLASEFESPSTESEAEQAKLGTLLEIYAPVRSRDTNDIIAVAEFYEAAEEIKADLTNAKIQSWLVTGSVLILIIWVFSSLIRDGSRTIDLQKRELTRRVAELSAAVERTKELRDRIENGAKRAMEEHERFLRDVGSDLHDGPAQLISLALLRLDELVPDRSSPPSVAIRSALTNSMRDIRGISSGLLLPNIEGQKLRDCIRATVRDHELKTNTKVTLWAEHLPEQCLPYVKICLCRFVQEGLYNAYRHAGGRGQCVTIGAHGDGILAEVSDDGPGIVMKEQEDPALHLGLLGLRGRLESLRGTLTIMTKAGGGTTLAAWLPLDRVEGEGV